MPLTIAEHSKNLKDDMESGISDSWLEAYPWRGLFTVKTLPGRSTSFRRVETLGSVGKRSINEEYTESTGTTSRHTATMELLGGYARIDKELLDEPTYQDEASLQMKMKTRAIGYAICDDLVNGDPGSDPEEIMGLKVLSGTLASRQVIDAAGLDLTTGTQREANADEIIRLWDLAIQRIKSGTGHRPSFILLNDTHEQFVKDAFRRGDRFSITRDVFDNTTAEGDSWKYQGIPVYDAGFLADQSTKVITDNHDGNGYTSAYFVYSSDETTRIIQKFEVSVSPRHLMENQIQYQWMVETCFGLEMRDKFSIVRLKGVDVTA